MSTLKKHKVYFFLATASSFAYMWIYAHYFRFDYNVSLQCIFKYITTIPCPSCGVTRSIILLLDGRILDSIKLNPLGLLIFPALLIIPSLIVYDTTTRCDLLVQAIRNFEIFLNRKAIAIPLITLVLLNWTWNVFKHL